MPHHRMRLGDVRRVVFMDRGRSFLEVRESWSVIFHRDMNCGNLQDHDMWPMVVLPAGWSLVVARCSAIRICDAAGGLSNNSAPYLVR